jgi:hypothetical protein
MGAPRQRTYQVDLADPVAPSLSSTPPPPSFDWLCHHHLPLWIYHLSPFLTLSLRIWVTERKENGEEIWEQDGREKRVKREGTREPLTCLPPRSLLSTSRFGVPALAHHWAWPWTPSCTFPLHRSPLGANLTPRRPPSGSPVHLPSSPMLRFLSSGGSVVAPSLFRNPTLDPNLEGGGEGMWQQRARE